MGNPQFTNEECRQAALEFVREHGYQGDELPPYQIGSRSEVCPVAIAFTPFEL